jgi:uncharacterized surface protein with fasciclin (FAS1) repeats
MKRSFLLVFTILMSHTLFSQTTTVTPAPSPTNAILPNTTKSAPAQPTRPDNPGKERPAISASNSIMDNIARMKSLSKFLNALQIAGLSETFRSVGPITLFIPDDEAFEKMSKGKLDTLLRADHRYELIAFITYHAVSGKINSRNIIRQIATHKNKATFTTLSGGKLTAKTDAGKIILIDETGRQSTINQNDITQSNGMLFVIDTVLLPKNRLI